MPIIEMLEQLEAWHWLVLGMLLLGAEALGASGFMIGAGIAAIILAVISWFVPELGWQIQIVLFALGAIVFTVGYWRYFKDFNEQTDHQQINDRAAQMIGRKLELEDDLPTGDGKIQIGDTLWKIKSESPLKQGDLIEVIGSEDMLLIIKKA